MTRLSITSLFASAAILAGAESLDITVEVANRLAAPRSSWPVTVSLSAIAPGLNITRAAAVVDGKETATQLDDLDGDGIADELAMVVDLPANSVKSIDLTLDDEGTQKKYTPLTYAYIKLRDEKKKHVKVTSVTFPGDVDTKITYNSIYGHGAVAEGIHNAIRVYMDNRQSIDLYGKSTPQLEMDVTGFYTTPEQLAQGYGRDILWAGKSVAAGSFRGFRDGRPVTIDTVLTRGQSVLATGPVRSIIEVTDKGWLYNGKRHNMTQRYILYAGRHDFNVEIDIEGITPADTLCTGIQKLETAGTGFITPGGFAGSWGSNIPDKKAPELTEELGLGLFVNPASNAGVVEDGLNYLTLLRPDGEGRIRYSVIFRAAREKEGPKSDKEWFGQLGNWRTELAEPCTVTIRK